MTVFMRSNDVWLGAAYDFFQFTRVQIAIASVLGIEPGKYTHHVGSLHIYEQHYEAADKLKYADTYEQIPAITAATWKQVSLLAGSALTAAEHNYDKTLLANLFPLAEGWYAEAMIRAIKKNQGK